MRVVGVRGSWWTLRGWSSEDKGEPANVVDRDPPGVELDVETVSEMAPLAEDRPRAVRPDADLSRGGRGRGSAKNDDVRAVAAADSSKERGAGQPSDRLCLGGTDERGEVSGGGAVFEVARAAR